LDVTPYSPVEIGRLFRGKCAYIFDVKIKLSSEVYANCKLLNFMNFY
jgi:hypothetical protein